MANAHYKWFSMRIDARLRERIKRVAKLDRRPASNWATGILEKAVIKAEKER